MAEPSRAPPAAVSSAAGDIVIILQALINGLLLGGVYAMFSAGFSLIFGVMGVVNIAHGEMIMLGAFTTYWLFAIMQLDPFMTLPLPGGLADPHMLCPALYGRLPLGRNTKYATTSGQ